LADDCGEAVVQVRADGSTSAVGDDVVVLCHESEAGNVYTLDALAKSHGTP
jgi:hypothetical protein